MNRGIGEAEFFPNDRMTYILFAIVPVPYASIASWRSYGAPEATAAWNHRSHGRLSIERIIYGSAMNRSRNGFVTINGRGDRPCSPDASFCERGAAHPPIQRIASGTFHNFDHRSRLMGADLPLYRGYDSVTVQLSGHSPQYELRCSECMKLHMVPKEYSQQVD